MSWTTIQLGSREHYSIPLALNSAQRLERLLTDAWLSPREASCARMFSPSLAARRSDLLPDALVTHHTLGRVGVDILMKFQGLGGWDAILRRNDWFQAWAGKEVQKSNSRHVFSYAYTAQSAFRAARERDACCILGQPDPGPEHYEFISRSVAPYQRLACSVSLSPPKRYWQQWREEVELADKIIVNSAWSMRLLETSGVSSAKVILIPCVYADKSRDESPARTEAGANSGRVKLLFLGSVSLAKGLGQLFQVVKMLQREAVDFVVAGPIEVNIPDEVAQLPNVRFLGAVDKSTAEKLYRESDVFLFPTLSDGFGLTQLEALGHGLPVIASTHCGKVVEDGVSGLVLPEVTPEAIADAIMQLVRDRDFLHQLKANARVPDEFHPRHLAPALLALEKD